MKRISGATAISHLATILLVATLTVVFNTTNGAATWALACIARACTLSTHEVIATIAIAEYEADRASVVPDVAHIADAAQVVRRDWQKQGAPS